MSRRNPSRAVKRARSPLAELQINASGDVVDFDEKYNDPPDLSILSLASAQVDAVENQPPPPKQRKKRSKYNGRLNLDQREEILHMWISDGLDAPHIIASFRAQRRPYQELHT